MGTKQKNIVAFSGSPRKGGNTDTLLDILISVIKKKDIEVDKVYLGDLNISGCKECFKCQKVVSVPGCAVEDDMQPLYDKILKTETIILATPVFTWAVSALTKVFLERWYCLAKFGQQGDGYISLLEGKKAALLVTAGGDEFDGADLVVEGFKRLLEFKRMESLGQLVIASVGSRKDILRNPQIKHKVDEFGQKIISW